MIKFLALSYPIQRMKIDGRFKRVIITEKGIYLLGDDNGVREVAYVLLEIMDRVFSYKDVNLIKEIIAYHLGIK